MKNTQAEASSTNESNEAIPQPWEMLGVGRDAFMQMAMSKESTGARLAVEVLVNAYTEHNDEYWVSEYNIYRDWRTGAHIYSHDPTEEDAPPAVASLFIVERRLAEKA